MICDYRGGTYISQVSAVDQDEAVRSWVELIRDQRPMGKASIHVARNAQWWLDEGDLPVPLDGLTNAWCMTARSGGDLVLVNIVRTA